MAVALAEKQQTTLVGVLASSSGIALILASLASLLIVYSLVLFIRSFIGSLGSSGREQNGSSADGRASGRRQLCRNCSILHGGRSSKGAGSGGQQLGENQLTDYYYAQQDPGQPGLVLGLTCSECSVGLNKQSSGKRNMRAFYGTSNNNNNNSQQHQIIFGKSKDSILVPELVCSSAVMQSTAAATTTNGSNKLTLEKLQQDRHEQDGSGLTSINLKTVIEFADQENDQDHEEEDEEVVTGNSRSMAGARFNDLADYNFSPITTRVLTDEKGHSIKIRIASPPPQRQRQLVQLHRRQYEDSIAAAAAAAATGFAGDRKRDSCTSDCPLISLGALSEMSQQQQHQEQPNERDESVFEAGGASASAWAENNKIKQEQQQQQQQVSGEEDSGASSGGQQQNDCSIKRRHSLSGPASKSKRRAAIGIQHEKRVEQDYSGSEAAAAMTAAEAPIEAFNDSNTSEFDDVPGCDSRQDTSLDYQQPHNTGTNGAACGISVAQRRANEQVMDADLRQTNRLNLELALLQNTATQNMCLGGGVASKSSVSGSGQPASERHQLTHHNHHHLPQSGVLHLASELSNTMAGHYQYNHNQQQQQQQQRRKHLQRRQSSQDGYDSGCVHMGDESSRRSSCFSGLERSGGSTMSSPTSLLDNNGGGLSHSVPSLRVEIRRLPPPSRVNATEVAPLSEKTNSNTNNRPLSTKVALFYTMGISSLSRSKSLEDTDVAAHSVGGGGGETSCKEAPQQPDQTDSDAGGDEEDDPLYEISLIEANNVLKLGAGQSWAPATTAGSSSDEQGGRSSPSLANNRRRSSLLGALGFGGGGAVSPSSQRRSSIDGVFVRVFKQAVDGSDSQQHYQQRHQKQQSFEQPENSANACNVSLASYTGPSGGAPRPDFIQLPLVKLAATSLPVGGQDEQQQQQQQQGTTINFQQLAKQGGYKFTCSRHELPVRVSLYMVSKRGGARYTLGHCIIAPEDWHQLECRDRLAERRQQTAADGYYDEREEEEEVMEDQLEGQQQDHFWPSNKFVVTPGSGAQSRGRRGRVNSRRSLSSGTSSNSNNNNPFETISEGQEVGGNEFELPETKLGEHEDENEEGPAGYDDDETGEIGYETGGGARQTNFWTLEYRLHQTILEAIKSY